MFFARRYPEAALAPKIKVRGYHIHSRIFLESVIQHHNMQNVEQLPLVFVQTLDLDIIDGVRIYFNILSSLNKLRERDLILFFDAFKSFDNLRVILEGLKLFDFTQFFCPLGSDFFI
jgi:hypothetical protein